MTYCNSSLEIMFKENDSLTAMLYKREILMQNFFSNYRKVQSSEFNFIKHVNLLNYINTEQQY